MRREGLGVLLLLALAVHAGDLERRITGGKAKRLVDKALPLVKEADRIYKDAWVFEKYEGDELIEKLKRAVKLYDDGTALLSQALEIQYDAGVNHTLTLAARKLAKMRGFLLRRQNAAKRREPPAPPPEQPEDRPQPEPEPEPAPPRRPEPEEPEPLPPVEFAADAPPGTPVDVDLPSLEGLDTEALVKQDKKGIAALLKGHFGGRKSGKLLFRHKLCRGKGVFSDGTECAECCGTGRQINLYEFRKAFWNCYTPLLRDSAGALDALKAFHARATKEPDALGPLVKTFKLEAIDHHGTWAKVKIATKTTAGEQVETYTIVSIGSSWYFYHPGSDRELVEG